MDSVRPEDRLIFRSFNDEIESILSMMEIWCDMRERDIPVEDAFFFSWKNTHPESKLFDDYCFRHEDRLDVPAEANGMFFYQYFWNMMNRVLSDQSEIVTFFFSKNREPLLLHNWILSCVDQAEMLDTAIIPLNDVPEDCGLEKRRILDARKILAITMQYIAIDLADPHDALKASLNFLERVSLNRLMRNERIREFYFVTAIDPCDNNRIIGAKDDEAIIKVVNDANEIKSESEKLIASGYKVKTIAMPWICRMITEGDTNYYVYVTPRPKNFFSTLRKLESGGKFTDRRGTKYILVAVEEEGKIRTGRRIDVYELLRIIRERLWSHKRMNEERDDDIVSKYRNENYWDCKMVGRLELNGIIGGIEIIVTDIADHLSVTYSTGDDNHWNRRYQQLIENICPLWWPQIDWSCM